MHPLDHVVWSALTTQHASFAIGNELAKRYPAEVAPFVAVREPSAEAWSALAILLTPGVAAALFTREEMQPPATVRIDVIDRVSCEQMVVAQIARPQHPELVRLGPEDVPEMLALVELTHPGPFAARTSEMGAYYGIRRDGRLVAMTGERMHLDGFTEVSAVCVHPDHLRQGLAAELIRLVAHGILARGETPMLHVRSTNAPAIALYTKLGFTVRSSVHLAVIVA